MRSCWSLHVPLFPDELFSSWLARAALVQGCDPLKLTGAIWPRWRIWTRDPDRGVGPERLRTLAIMSCVDELALEAATMRLAAELIASGSVDGRATWPWMLALGARNRRRHGGLQFCPACLAGESVPYYRLQWRFAWHTGCARHGCALLDRCPHCGAPLEPHRLLAEDANLAVCANCKRDLREARTVEARTEALAFQVYADHVLTTKVARYGDNALDTASWFTLARWYVSLLRAAARRRSARLADLGRLHGVDIDRLTLPATGLALELLPVAERAVLLSSAWRVLVAGPDMFLRAAKEAGVTANSLCQACATTPVGVAQLVAVLPRRDCARRRRQESLESRPRSRTTVMRMWARFKRNRPVVV